MVYMALLVKVFTIQLFKLTSYKEQSQHFNATAILWDETTLIDQAKKQTELFLKEALHTNLTPKDKRFDRDTGTDLPWLLDPHSRI